MKKPHARYLVRLAKPGSKPGDDEQQVFYFTSVKGHVAYLGGINAMYLK